MADIIGRQASITVSSGVATVANGYVVGFELDISIHDTTRFGDVHNRFTSGINGAILTLECWIDSATTPPIPTGSVVDVVFTLASGRTYTASGSNGGGIIQGVSLQARANNRSPAQVVRYVIRMTAEGAAGTQAVIAA